MCNRMHPWRICLRGMIGRFKNAIKFRQKGYGSKFLCANKEAKDCLYVRIKLPMQAGAYYMDCTHIFGDSHKASMHIHGSVHVPQVPSCRSLMHIQSYSCGLVQLGSSEQTNNVAGRKMLERNDVEAMSLDEVLALLDCNTCCVSVAGFIHILHMCRKKKNLDYAKHVHRHIRDHELEVNRVLGGYLVPTFVECGSLHDADEVFQRLMHRNEYSWTALIQGYVDRGESEHAFNLYHDMQDEGINPNTYTFQALLRGCIQLKSLERGRKLHFEIARDGLESHPFVGSGLVDMYAKCDLVEEARDVFDELPSRDVVVWTALIGGYAEQGHVGQVLSCLELMQEEGISPNAMTLVCSLKGCRSLGTIDRGQGVHAKIMEESLEGDLFIGNALVDMYVKCGLLEDACRVFDRMPHRDVVSWSALMMGYGKHGLGVQALASLKQMRKEGVSPNDVTYICSVKACGGSGSVDIGLEVHAQALKEGFDRHAAVGNSLVDMYAKCGSLLEAWETFHKLHVRDLVSWSALIAGYAHKGESKVAFSLFERMKEEGIEPDSVVLLGILNACSHAGLVLKGKNYFEALEKEYSISPTVEHYNCIVDLLGRAGQLKEALEWLEEMPLKPNFVSWSTLLGACQKWCNVELGRCAFNGAVRLDETQITSYVVMSSIYVDAGMWEEANKIDVMRTNVCV